MTLDLPSHLPADISNAVWPLPVDLSEPRSCVADWVQKAIAASPPHGTAGCACRSMSASLAQGDRPSPATTTHRGPRPRQRPRPRARRNQSESDARRTGTPAGFGARTANAAPLGDLPSRDDTTPGTTPILEFRPADFGLTAGFDSTYATKRDSFDPMVLLDDPGPSDEAQRSASGMNLTHLVPVSSSCHAGQVGRPTSG